MKQHPQRFLDLVNKTKTTIKETDVQTVQNRIDQGETFLLIDVREDNEWQRGRIPQAQHLGKGVIERDIEQLTNDPQQEIILYCGGGYRSALAAQALQNMGYENVWSMDGGYSAWCQLNT